MDINYTDNPDVARSGEAFWFDDDKGQGLIDEVWAERRRQIEGGYTHAHDDEHGVGHLIEWAEAYFTGSGTYQLGHYNRDNMIKGIALMVAAVEALDRAEES